MKVLLNRVLIAWWLAPFVYLMCVIFLLFDDEPFKTKHEFGVEMMSHIWNGGSVVL